MFKYKNVYFKKFRNNLKNTKFSTLTCLEMSKLEFVFIS